MTESILILGSRGMLGSDLTAAFTSLRLTAWDKEELDVTDGSQVRRQITKLKPAIIINATGYTDVDGAEDNRALAFALNETAVKNIAKTAAEVAAKLVHFSTEYVFDGHNEAGYDEEALPNPLSVYGQSKAAGERAVIDYTQGYLVRTSWLYGQAPQRGKPRGLNFIEAVLKQASAKGEVGVVNDQFGKLTYTKDLASAVRELIFGQYKPGVYHLINEGLASWYDVAKEVWRIKGLTTSLIPITSAEYPMKANRPKYSLLINTKFAKLRSWPEALADYLLN